MKRFSLAVIGKTITTAVAVLTTQSVLAAGFYISEVGTPLSLGTAGVANPTNTYSADSSWTNPAGMTGLKQSSIIAGLQAISPNIQFDSSNASTANGGNDGGKGITDVPGGLKLQCEGHDVRYRNIWIKELELEEANTDFKE